MIRFTIKNKFNIFDSMGTLFIGQNTIFLPEVDSTNSYAMQLLKNVNLAEGTTVFTTNQTQGRGQRGNTWESEPGLNLAVTYILKPGFLPLKKIFYLYLFSALAVYDVMSELLNNSQYDIKIKWPNDILINDQKIAGILNENIIKDGIVQYCLIGVGININQTNLKGVINATSLKLQLKQEFDIEFVLLKLNEKIEKHYMKMKNLFSLQKQNHSNVILDEYLNRFYKLNKICSFEINGLKQNLTVEGINDEGLLVLKDLNGDKKSFDLKEIKWVF